MDKNDWIATAWSTQTHKPIAWTGVRAGDETDAHIKGREKLCERIGGYGGWTVTLKQIESAEVAPA